MFEGDAHTNTNDNENQTWIGRNRRGRSPARRLRAGVISAGETGVNNVQIPFSRLRFEAVNSQAVNDSDCKGP